MRKGNFHHAQLSSFSVHYNVFQFLSDKLLKERLEIDTLQEVGILKNRNFYTKFIKVKTKL